MIKHYNKVLFYSPLFGYVELNKRGLAMREDKYKGQLRHDWLVYGVTAHGLELIHFRKGQFVWLSREHFRLII